MIDTPPEYREYYPELCELIDYALPLLEDAAWDAHGSMMDGEDECGVISLVSQLLGHGYGIPPHLCDWAAWHFENGNEDIVAELKRIKLRST